MLYSILGLSQISEWIYRHILRLNQIPELSSVEMQQMRSFQVWSQRVSVVCSNDGWPFYTYLDILQQCCLHSQNNNVVRHWSRNTFCLYFLESRSRNTFCLYFLKSRSRNSFLFLDIFACTFLNVGQEIVCTFLNLGQEIAFSFLTFLPVLSWM